jgi:hypothetical protein
MNDMFEIAVFEYSDPYSGQEMVSRQDVVKEFVKAYKKFLPPKHCEKDDIVSWRGRTWLSYVDKSGNDKPMTIMLIGTITKELEQEIERAVEDIYKPNTEEEF